MTDEHDTDSRTRVDRADHSGRELRAGEGRSLVVLALPTLGLALSITVVSTDVPVLLRHLVSSTAGMTAGHLLVASLHEVGTIDAGFTAQSAEKPP